VTRMRQFVPALCCLALLACERPEPLEAPEYTLDVPETGGRTDLVEDEKGDAHLRSGDAAPGYLDQVGGAVTPADEETLRFVAELASPVPFEPELPNGDNAIGWSFCLDMDPDSATVGFPSLESISPCEFVLRVAWDGRNLQGFFIDRRPLMEARYSQIERVRPTLRKSSIELLIPLEKLGYPTRFDWSTATEEFESLALDAIHQIDELPDSGASAPETWRSTSA
jgi:hypothetical protein